METLRTTLDSIVTGFNRHTRVGSKPRSEGRLFTRTDQVRAPQVPTLHVRQRPIRICGALLQTVHFTPDVHPDREGDRGGAPEAVVGQSREATEAALRLTWRLTSDNVWLSSFRQ